MATGQIDKRDLTLIIQSLEYIGRRLKDMKKTAGLLANQGFMGVQEFLDTYGFQTFINDLKDLEDSVVELRDKLEEKP